MIAGFKTTWPKKMGALAGEPTNFVEQIWKGFGDEPITAEFSDALHAGNFNMEAFKSAENKLHTIREDRLKRWKIGMDIHYYINVRKTNMLQFAPVKKVKSIQTIYIKRFSNFGNWEGDFMVFVDGFAIKGKKIKALALNDGFPSVEAFFQWFNKDFTGRIIHWTNIKY